MTACTSACGFCGACTNAWEQDPEPVDLEPETPFDEMDATLERIRQQEQNDAAYVAYIRKLFLEVA